MAWWSILVEPIASLLDKVIPDKDARYARAHEIAKMVETQAFEMAKAQAAINQQEAAHKSLFVAGWRPAIGWICGIALAWSFVVLPILLWITFFVPQCPALPGGGFDYSGEMFCVPDLATAPKLDMSELMTVLLGMLGLGGMRSYEKRHGVSREQ